MIKRGEIYFVTLDPTRGREQAGRRPVLVLSIDALNRLPLVVTVVPGTSAANVAKDYPTNVRVRSADTGLPHDTVFLGYQVRALDHARFVGAPAGRMPTLRMVQVEDAVRRSLGL